MHLRSVSLLSASIISFFAFATAAEQRSSSPSNNEYVLLVAYSRMKGIDHSLLPQIKLEGRFPNKMAVPIKSEIAGLGVGEHLKESEPGDCDACPSGAEICKNHPSWCCPTGYTCSLSPNDNTVICIAPTADLKVRDATSDGQILATGCSVNETSCNDGEFCCPSGSTCVNSSQLCLLAGNSSGNGDTGGGNMCPVGYDPCPQQNGCCPSGVQCLPPSFCDLQCTPGDMLCPSGGCCSPPSVCVNNAGCSYNSGGNTGGFSSISYSPKPKTSSSTPFIDISDQPTPTPTTPTIQSNQGTPVTRTSIITILGSAAPNAASGKLRCGCGALAIPLAVLGWGFL